MIVLRNNSVVYFYIYRINSVRLQDKNYNNFFINLIFTTIQIDKACCNLPCIEQLLDPIFTQKGIINKNVLKRYSDFILRKCCTFSLCNILSLFLAAFVRPLSSSSSSESDSSSSSDDSSSELLSSSSPFISLFSSAGFSFFSAVNVCFTASDCLISTN